jgi:transcriptional regulatory protein LevR
MSTSAESSRDCSAKVAEASASACSVAAADMPLTVSPTEVAMTLRSTALLIAGI